jgi:hypothetical protein
MYKIFTSLFLFVVITAQAQIKGTITSADGQPVPFVSITIENTYTGTTANEEGKYELMVKKTGSYTLLFQSIGYKPAKVTLNVTSLPYTHNITLQDESYQLNEVVISNTEDPAYAIIRQAIAHKKENSEKAGRFEADFYSKGLFKVKDVPKKIMGVEVGDMDGTLDSTGTGIIYLSETVSKITFEQPDNLKERIIASKVSGNDKGFSYNTAMGTHYNFYNNYIKFNINMVSPLANNAFNYYRFKLEGSFFDENNNQINKIKVIPRRDKEPVFEGYIYIVDDSWAIYAIDFDIKGYRTQQPILENLNLKQNFSYNSNNRIWAKNSQTFDLNAGLFGIKFNGNFTHVYTNYVFHDSFDKKTFGKEIVYIEEESNKKDSTYWNVVRPVPLTSEEANDYVKKDSLQELRSSKTYLDSIDRKHNKFKAIDILMGYSYSNSYKKTYFNYKGLADITSAGFNTVQGWNMGTGFSLTTQNEDKGTANFAGVDFNYGFAEDRLRVTGRIARNFGRNKGTLHIYGGSKVQQFNLSEPITPLINTVSTLFFKDNYMKLYDKTFAAATYGREVFTGLNMQGTVEYSRRKPLFNNTDYVLIKQDDEYTSNNPLDPYNEESVPFEKHNLVKATVGARINFGQKYITRPDGKINVSTGNYPSVYLQYEKAFAGSEKQYEYDYIGMQISYNATLGNKGDLGINLKGGKFFNAENISFADYKHFNGNQTHIGTGERYLNVFNLLPYYSHSTNDQYFEAHAEHNFKGYIMNKIPLLNELQWNLVVGYHNISTPDYKPYHEFTAGFDNIGIGKFRFLRVDYIRAYQGGFQTDGVVFGMKFLDIL